MHSAVVMILGLVDYLSITCHMFGVVNNVEIFILCGKTTLVCDLSEVNTSLRTHRKQLKLKLDASYLTQLHLSLYT